MIVNAFACKRDSYLENHLRFDERYRTKKSSYNAKQSSSEDENLLTMEGATDNVPFNHTPGAGRRKLCNQQFKAQRNLVFS